MKRKKSQNKALTRDKVKADVEKNTSAQDESNTADMISGKKARDTAEETAEETAVHDIASDTAMHDMTVGTAGVADDNIETQDKATEEVEEEVIPTNQVLDSIMSDKRKILTIVGAFLLLAGSYLSFWGVYSSEYGRMSQGNLFGGYMVGGILGKICVLAAMVSAVLVCMNMFRFAWYSELVSVAAFALQVLMVLIFGWGILGSAVKVMLYPGLGSFICIAGIIIMVIYIRKLFSFAKSR